MTSNTLAPCPQAEIDPDSLTALSDDEMLEGPPDWWAYSKKWRNELNRNRNEQRAFDWSLKNSARELIRFRIQNAKRDQENRAMLAALGLEEDSDSAEEEAEEETEEEAEQQAEEEHSNAEQQAEEEPSNAEQAAEDAPDGETEEQGDGQSE